MHMKYSKLCMYYITNYILLEMYIRESNLTTGIYDKINVLIEFSIGARLTIYAV